MDYSAATRASANEASAAVGLSLLAGVGDLRAKELGEPRRIVPSRARKRSTDHDIGYDIARSRPHALVSRNSNSADEISRRVGREPVPPLPPMTA